jgi:hypothetical protein
VSGESRRPLFLANGVFAAMMAWVYGRELGVVLAVRTAPAAALRELPSVEVISAGLACALLGLVLVSVGALTRRPASWRGFRVVPIAALLIIFVDFGVLGSRRLPGSPEQLAQLAVQGVAELAQVSASAEGLPADAGTFAALTADLGPAPYFVHGEGVGSWSVEVRLGCSGPPSAAGTSSPGTIVYCLSVDRRRAWVAAVGLKEGQRTGAPALVSSEDPYLAVVELPPREAADGGP